MTTDTRSKNPREPKRRVQLGPAGNTARGNVSALRTARGITLRGLAERMSAAGRPLTHTAISDIENGSRRIDVDDLLALAIALEVAPAALLMPRSAEWELESVQITDNVSSTPRRAWEWLTAEYPLDRDTRSPEPTRTTLEFRMRSWPQEVDLQRQLGFSPEGHERRNRQANPPQPVEWSAPDGNDGDD